MEAIKPGEQVTVGGRPFTVLRTRCSGYKVLILWDGAACWLPTWCVRRALAKAEGPNNA